MMSLLIPSTKKNSSYLDNIKENINNLYKDRHDLEIISSINDDLSLSEHYNKLASEANGEIIVFLHDDMILHRNFVDKIYEHIKPKRILTYTRIEPPIYNDQYPGKVLLDLGSSNSDFNLQEFQKLELPYDLIDGGSQLFFACFKEDYIGLDSDTFKLFCEDDDLHLRYNILGYEKKVCSAMVYHFVSKTSRSEGYQEIEFNSNRNFIRKWSFRKSFYNKKLNNIIKIKNCTLPAISHCEPFAYKIYTDLPEKMIDLYINQEQESTNTDLKTKIYDYDHHLETENINSIIEFDFKQASQQTFDLLNRISDIIFETGELGSYEIDCLKIKILSTTEQDLKCIL